MGNEKKIEIPFGAFDSELIHQEISIPDGFKAIIDGNKIILTRIESEDERIRKSLISYLHGLGEFDYPDKKTYHDWLEWLEKQGDESVNIDIESMVSSYEHRVVSQCNGVRNNPIVNMCVSAFRHGVENTLEELNLKKLEKQGEQKVNYTTLVETGNGGINTLVTREVSNNDYEEKPADKVEPKKIKLQPSQWNISDFRTWQYIVSDVLTKHDGIGQYLDNGFCKKIAQDMQNEWSKKLCSIQHTAWSEEDEIGWTNTMIMIKEVASNHYTKGSIKLVIDWLKSIKQRIEG